jgi:hypothetical protein
VRYRVYQFILAGCLARCQGSSTIDSLERVSNLFASVDNGEVGNACWATPVDSIAAASHTG